MNRPSFQPRLKWTWKKLQKLRHLYIAAVVLWYGIYGWKTFFTADVIFAILLPAFFLYGKGFEYVKRFLPFVALIMAYDSLRSIVPFLIHHVHFREMIDFDQWIGGGEIPSVALQQAWYHGSLHWYDYYFYFAYMLHFIAPFALAFFLWRFRPEGYWRFVSALLVLSYAGFITYLIFPAAPPWMAAEMGLIPPLTKISTAVWFGWGIHSVPTLYAQLNPNTTAAVPSLHAAYPMLDLLFMYRLFGRKFALPFLIYPVTIWVGVIYLGEHYVIDVLLGILYAVVAFYGTEWAYAKVIHARHCRKQRSVQNSSSTSPVVY